MRCFGLTFILIAQVFSNDAAEESHVRETRQLSRGRGVSAGGYNLLNNMPTVGTRSGAPQNTGLNLGLLNTGFLGLGVGTSAPQTAATMGFQAAQNAASTGGGYNMGNLGGLGPAQNAAMYGFQSAQNAANIGSTMSSNPGLINIGTHQNSGLVNLGGGQNTGLLNVGGEQNSGLLNVGGQSSNPSRNPGAGHSDPGRGPQRPDDRNPAPSGLAGTQGDNRRPAGQPTGRPGQQNGRPIEPDVYENERPGGQLNNGRPSGGSQGFGDENNGQGFNGGTVQSRPQGNNNRGGGNQGNGNQGNGNQGNGNQGNGNQGGGNQGGGNQGGKKKCRGNQYTCQNRECVARNARCNGVNECQDGSDEFNCHTSQTRPDSSIDYTTTAAPSRGTTASSTGSSGCILPEQPRGGSFELGSCEKPCNVAAGTRVPLTSFLTYKCDEGYTLKGNNVSFCHSGSWYLPPTCVKTCSPLKSRSVDIVCKLNGEIVSCENAIAPGTKATLACKHSYKLPLTDDPAYRELNCLQEGIWDRTLFRCLPECGTAVAHGNTLIVSGFTAKLGVFPWHVGIYQRNSANKFDQICAGTLISPDLVISAAHCFYDDTTNEVLDASNYAVGAGKHYRLFLMPEKYAQTSMVKSIEVASRYYGASGNFAEDISLVRLEAPFTLTTLVRPVCMDWDNTYEREQLQSGQSGKAVGWGKNAEGIPSNELQEINLPYIPYQECVSAVPEDFKGYVTADKFCAGYLNGSSLCEGDSGGGLCFQLNGLWYLRGIVSVSPVSENTCDNNYYTAFTNVGRFREWIRAAYVSAV